MLTNTLVLFWFHTIGSPLHTAESRLNVLHPLRVRKMISTCSAQQKWKSPRSRYEPKPCCLVEKMKKIMPRRIWCQSCLTQSEHMERCCLFGIQIWNDTYAHARNKKQSFEGVSRDRTTPGILSSGVGVDPCKLQAGPTLPDTCRGGRFRTHPSFGLVLPNFGWVQPHGTLPNFFSQGGQGPAQSLEDSD